MENTMKTLIALIVLAVAGCAGSTVVDLQADKVVVESGDGLDGALHKATMACAQHQKTPSYVSRWCVLSTACIREQWLFACVG